ncbi:response regulator transcription factor [Streptomyces goshikiensis]|uniref:response regulator transcription factor n=1 Tax=Streptomyces goshikiensis TaxID=1942 RepID=UPI0036A60727
MTLLTVHEMAVLEGAAAGETYAETGHRIYLTEGSISNVATRVMRKLGAASMPQAVLLACRAGLLDGRPQRHGDHAGYAAHVYRGEDPKACPHGCWEGEKAYRTKQRQARKALKAPERP